MPTLKEIVERQAEWIRMARKIGADEFLAEDLVSEMYLKLIEINSREGSLERIEYKGGVNTMFIFVTLRNLFIDECRKSKEPTEPLSTNYDYADREFENLCDCVDEQMNGEHWYNRKLFVLYHNNKNLSLRKLAKATGINYYSIFETIKNVRNHIKERCQSEYQAYQEARKETEEQGIRGYY